MTRLFKTPVVFNNATNNNHNNNNNNRFHASWPVVVHTGVCKNKKKCFCCCCLLLKTSGITPINNSNNTVYFANTGSYCHVMTRITIRLTEVLQRHQTIKKTTKNNGKTKTTTIDCCLNMSVNSNNTGNKNQ